MLGTSIVRYRLFAVDLFMKKLAVYGVVGAAITVTNPRDGIEQRGQDEQRRRLRGQQVGGRVRRRLARHHQVRAEMEGAERADQARGEEQGARHRDAILRRQAEFGRHR